MSLVESKPREAEEETTGSRRALSRGAVVRRVLFLVVSLLVLAVVGFQVLDLPWGDVLSQVQWLWVGAGAVFAAVSFCGAGWNLIGFSSARVGVPRVVAAQVAATGVKLVTPAGVGALAVNVRLLHRAGASTAAAASAVAGAQAAQLVVTVLLLVAAAVVPGRDLVLPPMPTPAGPAATVVVALVAVGVLVPVIWLAVAHRARLCRLIAQVVEPLQCMKGSPTRVVQGFGGALLLSAGLAGALWATTSAFDEGISVADALVIVLIGVSVGSALPTPGGTGGVEVTMAAGLVGAGVPLVAAAPVVVVYRLLTLWLPVPLGIVAGLRLRSIGAL